MRRCTLAVDCAFNESVEDDADGEFYRFEEVDAEIARLNGALAAAGAREKTLMDQRVDDKEYTDHWVMRAEAAEARVRELEALVRQWELRDSQQLAAANALLEWHRNLLDELRQLCFDTDPDPKPQWNAARDMNRLLTIGQKIDAARKGAHLSAQPTAPKRYWVWVGTEDTKERVVLETDDIEEAARTACADASGHTFWGMKPATPTDHDRAVLLAASAIPRAEVHRLNAPLRPEVAAFAKAELARREATR